MHTVLHTIYTHILASNAGTRRVCDFVYTCMRENSCCVEIRSTIRQLWILKVDNVQDGDMIS